MNRQGLAEALRRALIDAAPGRGSVTRVRDLDDASTFVVVEVDDQARPTGPVYEITVKAIA